MAKTDAPSLRSIPDEECQQIRARLDNISRSLTQTADQIHGWRNTETGAHDPAGHLVEWTTQHLRELSQSLLWCRAALFVVVAQQQNQGSKQSEQRGSKRSTGGYGDDHD